MNDEGRGCLGESTQAREHSAQCLASALGGGAHRIDGRAVFPGLALEIEDLRLELLDLGPVLPDGLEEPGIRGRWEIDEMGLDPDEEGAEGVDADGIGDEPPGGRLGERQRAIRVQRAEDSDLPFADASRVVRDRDVNDDRLAGQDEEGELLVRRGRADLGVYAEIGGGGEAGCRK